MGSLHIRGLSALKIESRYILPDAIPDNPEYGTGHRTRPPTGLQKERHRGFRHCGVPVVLERKVALRTPAGTFTLICMTPATSSGRPPLYSISVAMLSMRTDTGNTGTV